MAQDHVRVPTAPGLRGYAPEPPAASQPEALVPSREEAMRLDITHLLYAIDRGYFGDDNCIKRSEFIACLRKYATHDFRPITQERAA